MSNDDFNFGDTLDELIANAGTEQRESSKPDFVPAQQRWKEGCPACKGTGKWRGRGICFKCKGAGQREFKTSPEARARTRAKRLERKAQEKREWCAEHMAEIAWLERTVAHERQQPDPWQFPIGIAHWLVEHGTLTDAQLEAVQNCMKRE